jgi:zinc protease
MVDEGAGERDALGVSSALSEIGTTLVTLVDEDSTTLSLQMLRSHLDRGLEVLADVVLRPHLAGEELARIKEETHQRALERRGQPGSVAAICLNAALFGRHPYGRPVLPRPDAIASLRVGHLQRFHRRYYRPDNALLVVAGALTPEELLAAIERRLGSWRPGAHRRRRHHRPLATRPRLLAVDRPGASETVLRLGHLAPRRRTRRYPAIDLLNTVLGGSFTSRLNQNLRETRGLTYGVDSSFGLMRHAGVFAVRTSVETGATRTALDQIVKEIEALVSGGVTPEELDKARRLVVEELPARAETLRGIVDAHAELGIYNLAADSLRRMPRQVAALRPGEIRALARDLLHPREAAIVVVGDLARIVGDLGRSFGPAQRWSADGLPQQR